MTAPDAVVVSGASSGIGLATAVRLARAGLRVYAGVRTGAASARLDALGLATLVPLRLDVTEAESVDEARRTVMADGARLIGLVNNAGTHVLGPLELMSLDEVRRVVEVNLIGQLRLTQAMLPQLRADGGRLLFLSSIAGRLAAPMFGAYAASKFALEGACDALRRELRADGLDVILVEPGAVATPMWSSGTELAAPGRYAVLGAGVRRALVERSAVVGIDPDVVATVIERALWVRRPHARYLVGADARVRVRLAGLIPSAVVDRALVTAFTRAGRRSAA